MIHAHVRFASLVVQWPASSPLSNAAARADEIARRAATGARRGDADADADAITTPSWATGASRRAGSRARPYPLTLTPNGACPTRHARRRDAPCTIDMGAIAVRYWKTRNLAWNAGLAFALGGGKLGSQGLDTVLRRWGRSSA